MSKLELPSVTLMCADCYDVKRVIPVMEKCKSLCNFGDVKLFTSLDTDYPHKVPINHLPSHIAYSIFMLKRAPRLIETKHVLVVQHDGWILNPDIWNPDWLKYDYIGPLFIHRHIITNESVGSGGFSLRSRDFMRHIDNNLSEWTETEAGTNSFQESLGCYEDGASAIRYRDLLTAAGFKYAPALEASKFAQGGNCDLDHYVERPFGFHGLWGNINHDTGIVSPWPQDADY